MIKTEFQQPKIQFNLGNLVDVLNGAWHKRALQTYLAIVLAHLAEHIVQTYQIYILGWPISESRGILGYWFPWMVTSEPLHYGYALVMLVGLFLLRPGFVGRSRLWWNISLAIQFWHHIEHALLQSQAVVGKNLFDSPVPISIVQLWIPRIELHFLYNTLVFIPMIIAMYYHVYPPVGEDPHGSGCGCSALCELPNPSTQAAQS